MVIDSVKPILVDTSLEVLNVIKGSAIKVQVQQQDHFIALIQHSNLLGIIVFQTKKDIESLQGPYHCIVFTRKLTRDKIR